MNIITRTKNNLVYAYHSKRCDKALAKAKQHIGDPDDHEFKKWAKIGLESLKVCMSTPLK